MKGEEYRGPVTYATVVIVAFLLTGCPSAAPDIEFTAGERMALEALDLALRVEQEHGEDIWPGYSLIEEPLLIHRPGGRSFLVGAPAAPGEDVAPRDLQHLPRVVVIPPGELSLHPSLVFSKDVPVRGVRAFMIRHADRTPRLRWFRLLVHEVFHRYQSLHFVRDRREPLCRYPIDDEEAAARALVEQRRLGAALIEADADAAIAALRRALALRVGRYEAAAAGQAMRTIEDWEERLEGTARLVEDRYTILGGLQPSDVINRRIAKRLANLRPEDLQKWRYYHTGEALLLLLARLFPGRAWQHAVDDGATPFQAALDAAADNDGPIAPASPDPQALKEAREVVAGPLRENLALEKRLFDEWAGQGHLHVVLTAPSANAVTYSSRGVSFHLPDCSRFISAVTWFLDREAGLEVRDRSIVLDGTGGRAMYRLEFYGDLSGDHPVLADGVPPEPGEGPVPFKNSLVIRGDGWRVDHQGAGSVDLGPDHLRINIEPSFAVKMPFLLPSFRGITLSCPIWLQALFPGIPHRHWL